ncbi:penicillin-binding transpeptidase domain-containing protein [Streptomyces peucetius]|uniref:Penicillin-binding transpeptidase domain-containing protein n=1 Tax=Streptomyces peucetius TaxID=1950 RepID=A0ABY6IEP1_STRPE|nr:penicillin-binding transpeptidase domain-containing protein [Streptomyces peucetius]UYQ65361.1 penicillin-binding transpeptidase domain-containing protein [Streptomyces peucetius]
MKTTGRRHAALAVVCALLPTLALGCTDGADDSPDEAKHGGTSTAAIEEAPPPAEGLGDIMVAGRAVTGSEPSGTPKVPYRRTYTEGSLYAAVTGYRSMTYGSAGLEGVYNDELTAGLKGGSSRSGHVVTTIRPEVQVAAAEALGDSKGAAVAVDVETGHILAMVSTPSYDPSAFTGNARSDETAWNKILDDEDKPLLNKALRDAEAPRQTFYLVVAAAALEEGLYRNVDVPTRAPLPYVLPGTTTELTSDDASCSRASIRTALRQSCDNVFAEMAVELGHSTLLKTAEAFGFNDDALLTPVREAVSTYPAGELRDHEVALSGIGWGEVTATPLRMADVMAVIANGGRHTPPSSVDRIVHGDGTVHRPTRQGGSAAGRRVISHETAELLRSAVETAPGAGGVTAWVQPARAYDAVPTSWSLSYAQAKGGSTVAIAVRVENPTDATGDVRPAVAVAERMRLSLS